MGSERRLHFPREYRAFFGRSEVFRLRRCTVFRVPNGLGHFRLGITIKAKASSVQRNRVKRAIREAFRRLASALGSFDYNVVISGSRNLSHPYPRELGRSIRDELPARLPAGLPSGPPQGLTHG